jgi:hypothetical protein
MTRPRATAWRGRKPHPAPIAKGMALRWRSSSWRITRPRPSIVRSSRMIYFPSFGAARRIFYSSRAVQAGRWVSRPSIGYRMGRDESGKPVLLPDDQAPFVTEAFELVASGLSYSAVHNLLAARGFKAGKNQFYRMLDWYPYCGLIPLSEEGGDEVHRRRPRAVGQPVAVPARPGDSRRPAEERRPREATAASRVSFARTRPVSRV